MIIEIKNAKYLPGTYHMIIGGIYIVFDKAELSSTENLHLFNNDRFVCLIDHEKRNEVLQLMHDEGIEVLKDAALL
tara:strand:- start:893 stop:1120 length:228 start_codon:yes stop_codon:yes gene_type:complete